MRDPATERLLSVFIRDIEPVVPLMAVWAHGSLAAGDYQPGRSDLDLIAVVEREVLPEQEELLGRIHHDLMRDDPLAARLHCSYLTPAAMPDQARDHLTWAHQSILRRPVTAVTRRELLACGRVLYGTPPEGTLPPVSDAELTAFIRTDLAEFWRPALERRTLWMRDIWVDAGLLTFARAATTLRTGRLITKREALDALPGLGAPVSVVDDITRGRYGVRSTRDPLWRTRRAHLTRTYLRVAIDGTLSGSGGSVSWNAGRG